MRKKWKWLALLFLIFIGLSWPISEPSDDLTSRVLLDRNGELLRVWLNTQQQYRIAPGDSLDAKYRTCVLFFEDQRFDWHPGIDPIAIMRAIRQNWRADKVQSGASTITMQLARLQHPRERTWYAKLMESWQALRLEWQRSKNQIFEEYASWVPMGSNVVGVSTASWRFLGHSPSKMTWAESALLAVLPNQPNSLHLEKGRKKLLEKRNRLLDRMAMEGVISLELAQAAQKEPLPTQGRNFHFAAPHYAEWVGRKISNKSHRGTLDLTMQRKVEFQLDLQLESLRHLGVRNAAVLVMETSTGKVRAYAGSQSWNDTLGIGRNDGISAARSTGSLLKPFLYGLALERGPWTQRSQVLDVPTYFKGFHPLNADEKYAGMVTFQEALVRSLNVPAVRLLQEYGIDDFYWWLKKARLNHLFRDIEGYGLPLILGGAEASLQELVPLYAMLLQEGIWRSPIYLENQEVDEIPLLSPGAAYATAQMLQDVQRPDIDEYHQWLQSQVPVAWKTGTSFGARDAWAIGGNAQWTIGVWIGNFKGGGIDGISGARSAAPLLFALMNDFTTRNQRTWIDPPVAHLRKVAVCSLSGDQPNENCPHVDSVLVPSGNRGMRSCDYHHKSLLNRQHTHEVCSRCWHPPDTQWVVRVSYPAEAIPFLRERGLIADALFEHNPTCPALSDKNSLQILYPQSQDHIFLPRNHMGQMEHFVAEAVHGNPQAKLWWFLDGKPLGQTIGLHKMPLQASPGSHVMIVQDLEGKSQTVRFVISQRS